MGPDVLSETSHRQPHQSLSIHTRSTLGGNFLFGFALSVTVQGTMPLMGLCEKTHQPQGRFRFQDHLHLCENIMGWEMRLEAQAGRQDC